MRSSISQLLTLSLAVLAQAKPSVKQSSIEWGKCNSTVPGVQCASLEVPLDYTDKKSNKTLDLSLLRIPASAKKSKGSILFNFGGPGSEARNSLYYYAGVLSVATGGLYDLVAFDPRGTGKTLPFICSKPGDVAQLYGNIVKNSVLKGDSSLENVWAHAKSLAGVCYASEKDTGEYLGTAFVARDLISVVDALGEDGLLRFWGISYGTTLGQTVAAMFPERIDKLILDGVQNVEEYYHSLASIEQWTQSDEVFSAIWRSCFEAGAKKCPLASKFSSAADIETAAWKVLDGTKTKPITIGKNASVVLDYYTLNTFYGQALYGIDAWAHTAALVNAILDNKTDSDSLVSYVAYNLNEGKTLLALLGIQCGDRVPRAKSLDEYLPLSRKLSKTTLALGDTTDMLNLACAQWKFAAKERFEGDFKTKTKNPALVISNKADGHTPIVSGRRVSKNLEGSALLEILGYGHSSLRNPSKCMLQQVGKYWAEGKLPEAGTKCSVDSEPFDYRNWTEVIKETQGGSQAKLNY